MRCSRALRTALACLLLVPAMEGCLLTRVMETRSQLCGEQPGRVILDQQPGRGLRVVFEQPTLTDDDVIRIVGLAPGEMRDSGAVRELSYEARPLHRPLVRIDGLGVKLWFVQLRGAHRLSRLELPEKFNPVLTTPLLDAAVDVACKAQVVMVPPGSSFDLTAIDRAALPTRDALKRLLGPPSTASLHNQQITYQFCLAPCTSTPPMVADLRFSFSLAGELQRAEASYFRYAAVVDLASVTPTATIRLQ